eukprot:602264-Rhodomonas_salina.1
MLGDELARRHVTTAPAAPQRARGLVCGKASGKLAGGAGESDQERVPAVRCRSCRASRRRARGAG